MERTTVLAEIITIGDELLIGQTVDTNSAWMGKKLNDAGVDVEQVRSIRDTKSAIINAVNSISSKTKLVLITGGLGPTKDDITKHTLLEYFGGKMVFNQEAYNNVERIFKMFGKEVIEVNRQQAMVPNSCKMLLNEMGTAPGMLFEKNGVYYVSMPGVPYEMKHIIRTHILPLIAEKLNPGVVLHRTILTHGIGESFLAERIKVWEENLNPQIALAYLPSPGMVKLRLTIKGVNRDELTQIVDAAEKELMPLIVHHVFGNEGDSLEKIIGLLLIENEATLATAESCTGGNIAHLLTTVPGSSQYFMGSVVSYNTSVKENVLKVKTKTLEEFGVVSKAVVLEMAEGVKNLLGTNYAIATSGIAGPDGGTEEKPVGTVWIAVLGPNKTVAKQFNFGDNRTRNIKKSSLMALDILRQMLMKDRG